MNFLLRTPFFRLLLALIAGIVACRFFRLFDLTLLLLVIPAFLSVLLSFFVRDVRWAHQLRWGFGAGLVVLVFVVGYLLADRQERQLQFECSPAPVLYRLRLIESPEIKARSVLCVVLPQAVGSSAAFAKSIVYFQKDSAALQLRRGDELLASVHFKKPDPVRNPEGFDYAAFLRGKGIAATAYVDSVHWKRLKTSAPEDISLQHAAEQARNSMLKIFRQLQLPSDDFAVLAALTLGYKDELEPEVRSHYSASGAMHILSVSGLHVGVIYLIVNSLMSLLFRKPSSLVLKTVCVVLTLWAYAFVTGLSPSVVRASSMFSLVAVGKALGRRAQIYNTISSTAFILLLLNPSYLYDVGFQLSYSAVAGIVYFQPKLSPLLVVSNKALKWLWDLTAVSLAAQIGTLPLALYYFNQFPNYFLLTNYIAIPLSTFIIYSAVSYLAVFSVPLVSDVVGWVLKQLLFLLNSAVAMIHSIPGSVSQVYAGSLELGVMAVVLFCWIGYAELKKYLFLTLALSVVLAVLITDIANGLNSAHKSTLLIYSDRKACHVHLIAGRREWIHTTDSVAFVKLAGKYRLRHRLVNQQFVVENGSYYPVLNGRRMVVICDDRFRKKSTVTPLKVDYLVVHSLSGQKAEELLRCFQPVVCIATAGLTNYQTEKLKQLCKDRRVDFYSIAGSGAYQKQLSLLN